MSGIAGLFLKKAPRVDSGDLERMSAALAHRGSHARGSWSEGPAGLAQRELGATERARAESQPASHGEPRALITADARIDHRPALLEALDLTGGAKPIGDAALILRAFERWGPNCPEHLRGDFAFAIWSPGRDELFCARDALGVKPLYYYDSDELFAFGSEIKALLALRQVPRRLDEVRLGFFLQKVPWDEERTFYAGIRRLPPGHSLTVSRAGTRRHPYFSVCDIQPLPPATDREYVEEYERLFVAAVRERLDADDPIGSMLSGGLDSSSIVGAARQILEASDREPLHTFSLVFDDVPQSDERPFIDAVLDGHREHAHRLRGDRQEPFAELRATPEHLDEASYGANTFLNNAIYRAAREAGVRVILDGTDGDSVVGYGFERLRQLAQRGRFLALRRELVLTAARLELAPRQLFKAHVRRPIVQSLRESAPQWTKAGWRALRGRSATAPSQLPLSPLIRPAFAERIDLRGQIEALHATKNLAAGGDPEHSLTTGVIAHALETLDRLTARHGLEGRYPYFDRAFVEFCVGLPPRMRLQKGLTRHIQRQAGGFLPKKVRWRDWKADLSYNFSRALGEFERPMLASLVRNGPTPVDDFVDRDALRRIHDRFLEHGTADDGFALSMVAGLATWLEQTGISSQSQEL